MLKPSLHRLSVSCRRMLASTVPGSSLLTLLSLAAVGLLPAGCMRQPEPSAETAPQSAALSDSSVQGPGNPDVTRAAAAEIALVGEGADTAAGSRNSRFGAPDSASSAAAGSAASAPVRRIVPAFENVAQSSGIDFSFFPDLVEDRYFLPEVMGGGAGWLDADCDGRLDLYLVNGAVLQPGGSGIAEHRNAFFRNRDELGFHNSSAISGTNHPGYGQGCIAGDFNADGFPDLHVSNYGPNALLVNNGDGTFSDVTAEAGVGDPRWGSSGVWVDLNQDRLEDLFVVNYLDVNFRNHKVCLYGEQPGYCGPGRYEGIPDLAFLNQGDGTFRDAAEELGFNPFAGKGLAVAVSDFNNDLLPDLYVANDMTANFLYTRSHVSDSGEVTVEPVYHEIAQQSGCAVSGDGINEASMGIACADFNRDGLSDLYLTHYYQMKNTLYRNLGGLMFEDDSLRTGVAGQSFEFLGFGTAPLDFNGDGADDLFVTNGHVLGPKNQPNAMTPQLLENDGRGNFADVSASAGEYFRAAWLGRGVASADYDDDGDSDLAITHLDKPVALLRNNTPTGRQFLGLSLHQSDRLPPLCARVTVTTGSQAVTRILGAGGSYLSSSDSRMTFALAEESESDSPAVLVRIQWPSGNVESYQNLTPGRYWRIVEGRPPETIPK